MTKKQINELEVKAVTRGMLIALAMIEDGYSVSEILEAEDLDKDAAYLCGLADYDIERLEASFSECGR